MRLRFIRMALWGAVLVCSLAFLFLSQNRSDSLLSPTGIVASNFGGTFTLIDHTGKTVTDKDFAGKHRLIYFGFTFCPAICPTELQRLNTVLNKLGTDAEQITPIFVTIDPERDTKEVMKNYVSMFHPKLIGLTGSIEQVEQIKNGYKIYAAKVQDETMSEYTMDHSTFLYYLDDQDNLVYIFKPDNTVNDMVNIIRQHLHKS